MPVRRRIRICQFCAHAATTAPGGPAPPAVAYVFADGRGTAMRQYWMPTRYRPDR